MLVYSTPLSVFINNPLIIFISLINWSEIHYSESGLTVELSRNAALARNQTWPETLENENNLKNRLDSIVGFSDLLCGDLLKYLTAIH